MVKKGPKKRADDDGSTNNHSTEQSIEGEASNQSGTSCNDAVFEKSSDTTGSGKLADNGAGNMVVTEICESDLIGLQGLGPEQVDLNEEVDWSLHSILNHPSGVDFALKQNLAIMEKQTKDLIENGSTEDLLKALEENTRQLEMLKERMEGNISWLTTLA